MIMIYTKQEIVIQDKLDDNTYSSHRLHVLQSYHLQTGWVTKIWIPRFGKFVFVQPESTNQIPHVNSLLLI